MINPQGETSVPLSTFGGLSTELSPADIPEGGSPDNQDMAFSPGSTTTRPGLARVYATVPDATPRLYHKSLRRLDGSTVNVFIHASGHIWIEDFDNAPGVFTNIMDVAAGSRCKSVTAGGKLYMAFNDGMHGTEIPRWFDGTKWGRVSQGGPCFNPTFSESIGPSSILAAINAAGSIAVTSAVTANPQTFTGRYWTDDGAALIGGRTTRPSGYWETYTYIVYGTIDVTVPSVAEIAVGNTVSLVGNTAINGPSYVVTAINGLVVSLAYDGQDYLSGTGGTMGVAAPTLARSSGMVSAGTAAAHGLNPGDMFSVSGVATTVVGGTIATAVRIANIATITTTAKHGIKTGNSVILAGVADVTFNGTWDVTAVLTDFAFQVTSSLLADVTSASGTVSTDWNNTQRFVVSTPTGISLTYLDDGPDCYTIGTGTITPTGQVAGGLRNAVCMFQTDTGFITPPSDPIQVSTSGDKKLILSGLPIGPANVVARIIALTGINGGNYFYIPVPARTSGNVISTSTVIFDNSSTTAVFDFSDQTLLSAAGIDIDGNNLFELKMLGNCSAVNWYHGRMFWLGDENRSINLKNMGFEGGIVDGNPAGWNVSGDSISVVTNADFGDGIQFHSGGTQSILSQSAYLDYYGSAIVDPDTQYSFKAWARTDSAVAGYATTLVAELYDSATLAVIASATITPTAQAGFHTAKFSAKTPVVIPSTLAFRIRADGMPAGAGAAFTVDEMSNVYTAKPWNDTTYAVSYVGSYESVDGLTGIIGSESDASPIMDSGELRDNFYFVTLNEHPRGGNLHTTVDIANSEPSGWSVTEVARNVGADSMDSMVSGESWLSWGNRNGAVMFDGALPKKITQDIQGLWESINPEAFKTVSAVNDIENRRIYWNVPFGASPIPNGLIVLDYRYGEDASDIEDRASVRVSQYTGKMLVTDLARKYTTWSIPATYVSYLQTAKGMVPVFSDALGRSYSLDPAKLHDDDYGTIPWYYVPSFFVSQDTEQAMQLGSFRHLFTFMTISIQGVGKFTLQPVADSLLNLWPIRGPYPLNADQQHDIEIPLNVSAGRATFYIRGIPIEGSLDSSADLSRMVVTMKQHPMSPISGRA